MLHIILMWYENDVYVGKGGSDVLRVRLFIQFFWADIGEVFIDFSKYMY